MLIKATILKAKPGTVITEVIDRQEHLCSSVYTVTGNIGKQISDEETGPECDPQTETTTGG
jgi:hypothetical protein